MKKDWKIYNSEKEWEKDGEKTNVYILKKIEFKITCNKCGAEAVVYENYEGHYDYYNIIKCSKCDNETPFYGSDG